MPRHLAAHVKNSSTAGPRGPDSCRVQGKIKPLEAHQIVPSEYWTLEMHPLIAPLGHLTRFLQKLVEMSRRYLQWAMSYH